MASHVRKVVAAVFILSFFASQGDCRVEHFTFRIAEKQQLVEENVEVDVEEQTVVFRVPQHNDLEAMEVINDFNSGLTARRFPSTQDCYVTKLDESLSSPEKLKENMKKTKNQAFNDNSTITIKKTATKVLGLASRLALPQKILDFCGNFPVYNVEELSLESANVTLHKSTGHGRVKRDHRIETFNACTTTDFMNLHKCSAKHNGFVFPIKCIFRTAGCYYTFVCEHDSSFMGKELKYVCNQKAHYINYDGLCCKAAISC